jgi:hypothetical protein
MCEVRSRKNGQEPKKKKKKKYSGQQQKEMDCDEPHPAPNEKTQPIQWTEWPTGALVATGSLCPHRSLLHFHFVMHPNWKALQSKFGITCDMSIENNLKSVASSHKCQTT